MSVKDVKACIAYNTEHTSQEELPGIAYTIGLKPFTTWGSAEVMALAVWQGKLKLSPDGVFGPKTRNAMARSLGSRGDTRPENPEVPAEVMATHGAFGPDTLLPLTDSEKVKICSWTFIHESGKGNAAYSACNADGEYKGLFDRPRELPIESRTRRHPASKFNPGGGYHVGLSFGRIQHAQKYGSLGKVLKMTREIDKAAFDKWAGGEKVADELIRVTTSEPGQTVNGRCPLTQPVAGADLWEEPWLTKFRSLGKMKACQKAQDKRMIDSYLEPVLAMCRQYKIDRHSLIAVLFDICVQCGKKGLMRYFTRAMTGVSAVRDGGRPEDVLRVINQLPRDIQDRRRNILRSAPHNLRYSL